MKITKQNMDALIFELLTEKFGGEWYLELAKSGAKFSYASKKYGNQKL